MQQGSEELRNFISPVRNECRSGTAGILQKEKVLFSQQTSDAPDTTPRRQSFPLLSLKPICVLMSSAALLPSIWNRWNHLYKLFVIVLKLYVQASKMGQIGTMTVAFHSVFYGQRRLRGNS